MDQVFWTNMVIQRPVTETNRARNPTAVPDDPTQVVTTAPRPRQSHSLLDGDKTGTVLLFSGVFLALVGVVFIAVGWHHYRASPNFEWTQLLGPVLISFGGTFMLTSVCRFGIISCWFCRQWGKEVLVMPVMEQTSAGHSFTLSAINQPIMSHNSTAMLRIPPQYNFTAQEVHRAIEFQTGASANHVHAACSPHDAVRCVDSAAFTAEEKEEDSSAHCTESDHRRSRIEKTEDDRGCGATCSPPPAYEDIYPSFNKHNLTQTPPETRVFLC